MATEFTTTIVRMIPKQGRNCCLDLFTLYINIVSLPTGDAGTEKGWSREIKVREVREQGTRIWRFWPPCFPLPSPSTRKLTKSSFRNLSRADWKSPELTCSKERPVFLCPFTGLNDSCPSVSIVLRKKHSKVTRITHNVKLFILWRSCSCPNSAEKISQNNQIESS